MPAEKSAPASLPLERAPLLKRFAAMCYDSFLIAALLFALAAVPVWLNGGAIRTDGTWLAELKQGAFLLYLLLGVCSFYVWFWTHGGQTLGMAAWKIRVVDENDQPLHWQQAFIRSLTACFGLTNFSVWLSSNGLAWHEKLSRSRTVQLSKKPHCSEHLIG